MTETGIHNYSNSQEKILGIDENSTALAEL
jgi:hypothetical protein